ncbi:hypothetical protein [Sulfurimonas microaerophilic]|uniref:hypothetical protein n=1 Tax=Sulfurimonas microaerophilic TaxID=3058392 RepID=UPI0027145772|nr:hypothetical protein [Sulfurimonas sp. hsl 1-7]
MLKIVTCICLVNSLFAVEMTVKKDDVIVSINTQKTTLKKGQKQELTEGSTICFVDGKGKVVIPALKKQLKKPGRCLMVPLSEGTVTSYMADMKHKATIALWDSSESVRHGTGTKGQTEFNNDGAFILTPEQKELVIYGKEFGPLPVVVHLLDANGGEVMSFENEESETTLVRIGKQNLKTGMTVEVYNGFEELMLSKKVIVKGL